MTDTFNYSKDFRTENEYEKNTKQGWSEEDTFYNQILPYCNSSNISIIKNGSDKDRVFQSQRSHNKVTTDSDFLMLDTNTKSSYYFGFTSSNYGTMVLTPKEQEHYIPIKKKKGGYIWRRQKEKDFVYISFTDPQLEMFKVGYNPKMGKICRFIPNVYVKNNIFPNLKNLFEVLKSQLYYPKQKEDYIKYQEGWIKDSLGMEIWGWHTVDQYISAGK